MLGGRAERMDLHIPAAAAGHLLWPDDSPAKRGLETDDTEEHGWGEAPSEVADGEMAEGAVTRAREWWRGCQAEAQELQADGVRKVRTGKRGYRRERREEAVDGGGSTPAGVSHGAGHKANTHLLTGPDGGPRKTRPRPRPQNLCILPYLGKNKQVFVGGTKLGIET